MKIRFFSFILASVAAISLLASCEKAERAVVAEEETVAAAGQELTVAEAVDALTKSVTKEDLKDLSLFLKAGSTDSSIYLKITDGEEETVSGEVSLVAGENRKLVGLNLMIYESLPVTGTVDVIQAGLYLAKARLCIWDPQLLNESLAKANEAIKVDMAYMYHVELRAVEDTEAGTTSISVFLVNNGNPDDVLNISDLIAMLG
jgi:hypothetical protein